MHSITTMMAIVIIALAMMMMPTMAQDPEPTPPVDKIWPFMFDTDSYSYQEYSNLFTLRTYNLPVSEGNKFTLNFTLSNMSINHNVHPDSAPQDSLDQVNIDVITQYWIGDVTERDIVSIVAPLNNTNGSIVPVEFPFREKTPTSSHQLIFNVPTHRIANNAGIDIRLTKSDDTLSYIMAQPFTIPGYNNTFVGQLLWEAQGSKMKKSNKLTHGFEITFNSLYDDIPFSNAVINVATNATADWTLKENSSDAKPCIIFDSKNKKQTYTVTPALSTTSQSPGTWSFVFDESAPIFSKGAKLQLQCQDWSFVVASEELLKEPLAYTFTLSFVDTETLQTLTRSNAILEPKLEGSNTWIVGVIVIAVLIVAIAAALFFATRCKAKPNRQRRVQNPESEAY